MKHPKINLRFGIIAVMILVAALSRLFPHPPNFTPIGGMALFGAAYFAKKYWAFIIPLIALFMSDLLLNNLLYTRWYPEMQNQFIFMDPASLWIYGCFILIALLGIVALKKVKPMKLLGVSIVASVIFFLVTNFSVWMISAAYPKSFAGLMACYSAGIPFFWNTLMGDLFYVFVLFGGFELIQRRFPKVVAAYG